MNVVWKREFERSSALRFLGYLLFNSLLPNLVARGAREAREFGDAVDVEVGGGWGGHEGLIF